MADVSRLEINENTYDLKDSAARDSITGLLSEMRDKEDVSNKVTSIDVRSTDVEYPSAKCVYDAIMDSDAFYHFTYGVTPYQDIRDAITAGKIPITSYNDRLFILSYVNDTSTPKAIIFGCSYYDGKSYITGIYVQANENWGERIQVGTTYMPATPTNLQIPTTKLLKDYVDANTGAKLFRHHLTIVFNTGTLAASITFDIINETSTAYATADKPNIGTLLNTRAATVSGNFDDTNANFCYALNAYFNSTSVDIRGYISSSKLISTKEFYYNDIQTISDTVGW